MINFSQIYTLNKPQSIVLISQKSPIQPNFCIVIYSLSHHVFPGGTPSPCWGPPTTPPTPPTTSPPPPPPDGTTNHGPITHSSDSKWRPCSQQCHSGREQWLQVQDRPRGGQGRARLPLIDLSDFWPLPPRDEVREKSNRYKYRPIHSADILPI